MCVLQIHSRIRDLADGVEAGKMNDETFQTLRVPVGGSATIPVASGVTLSVDPSGHVTETVGRRRRKYLPTFADLIDRLTITQMKAVFIPERKQEYMEEMDLILHDLDLIMQEDKVVLNADALRAICVVQLSNRFIWENESKAREGGSEQDKLLKLTHSINGVRNTAKNQLSAIVGGRMDYKTDCFAAELQTEFGNWNVFSDHAEKQPK